MNRSARGAVWGQWLAVAALLLVAAQGGYLLVQGESFCPTAGCEIVEEQSPLSPLWLNASGFVFFALLIWFFWSVRQVQCPGSRVVTVLLTSFLLAGIGAEGVLLAFQYHTGSFCLYCCMVLAAIAGLNLCLGGKQTLRALFVFAAVFIASVFFGAAKDFPAVKQDLAAGTFAHRPGQASGEDRYFFFSEDCSHCKKALAALREDSRVTLRLNPVGPVHTLTLPDFQLHADYVPEANRSILAGLGIETVPVLLVRRHNDGGDMQIFLGEKQIMIYLHGRETVRAQDGVSSETQSVEPSLDFLIPGDDTGCSVDVGCSQTN